MKASEVEECKAIMELHSEVAAMKAERDAAAAYAADAAADAAAYAAAYAAADAAAARDRIYRRMADLMVDALRRCGCKGVELLDEIEKAA